MALTKLHPTEDNYHGVPILYLRVGDPIPTPRTPERYAVRVFPDLARYLLTFNHERNRNRKERYITKYAQDMAGGLWSFTPHSIIFSTSGVLQDGQNRLWAITEYGQPVWLMVDFGWPNDLITAIDRHAARTAFDALKVAEIPNAAQIGSSVSRVTQYDLIKGTTRTFGGVETPSSRRVEQIVAEDEPGWQIAASTGKGIYRSLAKGASPAIWGAAYYIIAREDAAQAAAFFGEVRNGTGSPGSPSRKVADHFRRRAVSVTLTGDDREPLEIIIRAFNAWARGKSFSFPRQRGFVFSHPQPAPVT